MNFKFKIGDRVRVKFSGFERTGRIVACLNLNNLEPDYIVSHAGLFCKDVNVNFSYTCWPESCISLLPEPLQIIGYDVTEITKESCKVGCKIVPREQIEAVLKAMNESV